MITRQDKNVAYLVYRDGLGAIFDSAYLCPATRLLQRGWNVRINVLSPLGEFVRPPLRKRWRQRMETIDDVFPGRVSRIAVPPSRWPIAWDNSWLLAHWLKRHYGRSGQVVVHCGGALAALQAIKARSHYSRIKIVFHCWGPTAAEYRYRMLGHDTRPADSAIDHEADRLEALDQTAFRESDAVVCISKKMVEFAQHRYHLPCERASVIPCFVDTQRFRIYMDERAAIREALGVQDQFVVVYCGTLHRWQEPDGLMHVVRLIQRIRQNTHFLCLTTHPDRMLQLLGNNGVGEDSTTVKCVPYKDVPHHLAASDMGILARGFMQPSSLVNTISSPIKFAEYLACGCPVVLGDTVGDFPHIVRQRRVGVVLSHDSDDTMLIKQLEDFIAEYEQSREPLRQRCSDTAIELLSADRFVPRLESLYTTLSV